METRSRFLICLIGMTALCSFAVYHGDRQALSYTGPDYYRYVLLSGHAMLCERWVLWNFDRDCNFARPSAAHGLQSLAFIIGFEYLDKHTWLLAGPIPWLHVAVYILLAVVLAAASLKVIERRQF